MPSPTFSIINEYRVESPAEAADSPAGQFPVSRIFHFDFYRIDDPAEAIDLGLDEYFDSDALCLMEWPDNVAGLLPDDTLRVEIRVNPDDSRSIIIPSEA